MARPFLPRARAATSEPCTRQPNLDPRPDISLHRSLHVSPGICSLLLHRKLRTSPLKMDGRGAHAVRQGHFKKQTLPQPQPDHGRVLLELPRPLSDPSAVQKTPKVLPSGPAPPLIRLQKEARHLRSPFQKAVVPVGCELDSHFCRAQAVYQRLANNCPRSDS